ncbi:MAG: PIN domain-containing protein [Candidatus Dormibacteraeota bacterium]|nr:PIN domain-containing protein [Candidatus Dormibacteraeota bacterium]
MAPRRVVLDASAVLAWVRRERGAETVRQLFPHAVIAAPNLTESLYRARATGHRMSSAQLQASIVAMGAEIEAFGEADAATAADLLHYSAEHPGPDGGRISLGDACCLAVAERLQLPVAGDDRAWTDLPLAVSFHRFR